MWKRLPCPSIRSQWSASLSGVSYSTAPAMKSAITASSGMPLPVMRMPVWPVGAERGLHAPRAHLALHGERGVHLADGTVGAHGEAALPAPLHAVRDRVLDTVGTRTSCSMRPCALRGRHELLLVAQQVVQPASEVVALSSAA